MKTPLIGLLTVIVGSCLCGQTAAPIPPAEATAGGRANLPHLDPPVPTGPPINSAPNPYRTISGWFHMPEGRTFGSTSAVGVNLKNDHVWVAERCGGIGLASGCGDSKLDMIFEFDSNGKMLHNFGGGMIVFPHGLSVDPDGNVWVTDGRVKNGHGQQVLKFSPEGKLLMALGTPGVAGRAPNAFNQPNAVAFAPNGDIFIAEGHGEPTSNHIIKFTKDGKFIKEWGKKGVAPGEFDSPHCLAFDSKGRLLVGDRNNNRIQIFDQDGNFIEQFTQFSRPSGIAIDRNDVIYVTDSESESVSRNHFGWKRGIRIGSIKDGKITAYIPDPDENATGTSAGEGISIDSKGVIYGAEVGPHDLKKYVKQ